jgi:hypothetical protein
MSAPIDLLDLVRASSRAIDAAVGDYLGERVALPRLSWALRPHTWWHLVGSVPVPETNDVSHVPGLLSQWATALGLHPTEPALPGTARYLGGWRAPVDGQLGRWSIEVWGVVDVAVWVRDSAQWLPAMGQDGTAL